MNKQFKTELKYYNLTDLANTKKYTKFIKNVVQFELDAIKHWKKHC
jgi:hypothetical protein